MCALLEIALVTLNGQCDTERGVKLLRSIVRRRFEGKHNVQKQNTGTRDRVNQEVIIRGNALPLKYVPKYAFVRAYLKKHMQVIKRTSNKESQIMLKPH